MFTKIEKRDLVLKLPKFIEGVGAVLCILAAASLVVRIIITIGEPDVFKAKFDIFAKAGVFGALLCCISGLLRKS